MDVTYTVLVILGLVVRFNCFDIRENDTSTTSTTSETSSETSSTIATKDTTEIAEITTEITENSSEEIIGIRGLYGGSYYNFNASNPNNIHYIYGILQPPSENYYLQFYYSREDNIDEPFDYYLQFGLSRMTDDNFLYDDYHYFYHDINRTIFEEENIDSELVLACHPNATFFCPENTETICLMNGTIYCMSKISAVVPCIKNESAACVNTVVPCVKQCEHFEEISLPCLSTVIIVDVYEEHGKTLSRVGGTFILVDPIEERDRTFCVTVILDPRPKMTED